MILTGGQLMHSGRCHIPLEFGRPPRNISKHSNGFKAAEWSNWIVMYSVPLLQNKLSGSYVLIYFYIFINLFALFRYYNINSSLIK